jgi:hypothetical protein
MQRLKAFYSFVVLSCIGCATPNEVKQATTALDKQYDDNVALITQYRDTVDAMNQLEQSWSRYVRTRTLTNLAIESATQPVATPKLADVEEVLEGPLLKWVNAHRLTGLPEQDKLVAGHQNVSGVIQGLPELLALVRTKLDAAAAAKAAEQDLSAYDDYARRVAVLKSANAAVKGYLDVDVTVSKDDVHAIADAIKKLGAGKQ